MLKDFNENFVSETTILSQIDYPTIDKYYGPIEKPFGIVIEYLPNCLVLTNINLKNGI